ncbi:MAG TPA: esterase [Clostridiales bacterium]|nr:esterase [Clostridiales bacterium]
MKRRMNRRTFSAGLAIALPLIAIILTGLLPACRADEPYVAERLESFQIESSFLDKSMGVKVYLPPDYDPDQTYPVLYFLPDGGGSEYTIINEYAIGAQADELVSQGIIEPMLIVAADTDLSFGLNTAPETGTFETSSGKVFATGLYEDYLIQEMIPWIEEHYPTRTDRGGRYIGGYSAGGFAALYLAFTHPDLFSKVGGHSPSLFTGDFPDKTISDWLYPDQETRSRRDPLDLAQTQDLTGLRVYLDTGSADVNVEGCAALQKILEEQGVASELHLFDGSHSRGYCCQYMAEYLKFYGAD